MKKLSIILTLLIVSTAMAQKTKVKSGDFKFLKGVKEINVVFNFDNLTLMKENFSEEQYVKERKADLNEKTRGNGDLWEGKWESAKDGIWKTKFMELMLKTATAKKDILFQENLDTAKYTLVVDVVWIYPGWDAAVMKQKAKVSTMLRIVETANPANVMLEVESIEAPGDQWGNNFSNESRIGEGFAKTAKTFGNMIISKVK